MIEGDFNLALARPAKTGISLIRRHERMLEMSLWPVILTPEHPSLLLHQMASGSRTPPDRQADTVIVSGSISLSLHVSPLLSEKPADPCNAALSPGSKIKWNKNQANCGYKHSVASEIAGFFEDQCLFFFNVSVLKKKKTGPNFHAASLGRGPRAGR